jgi:hypothetical protein
MQTRAGHAALDKLSLLQSTVRDSAVASSPASPGETGLALVSHWLQLLQPLKSELQWLFVTQEAEAEAGEGVDSVEHCIWREKRDGAHIVSRVVADLLAVTDAKSRLLHAVRGLLLNLEAGVVPAAWQLRWTKRSTSGSSTLSVQSWLQQLLAAGANWAQPITRLPLWLPAVHQPEALLTASRQRCAQGLGWDIELLELQLVLESGKVGSAGESGTKDDSSLRVTGLSLEGASVRDSRLVLTSQQRCRLPHTRFQWRKCLRTSAFTGSPSKIQSEQMQVAVDDEKRWLPVPLYVDSSRASLVCEVLVEIAYGVQRELFVQRGVCFVIDEIGKGL